MGGKLTPALRPCLILLPCTDDSRAGRISVASWIFPCIFPILSIKMFSLAQHTGNRTRQVAGGVVYTIGAVSLFVALVGLLLFLRSSGEQLGWGFQHLSPVFAQLATAAPVDSLGAMTDCDDCGACEREAGANVIARRERDAIDQIQP